VFAGLGLTVGSEWGYAQELATGDVHASLEDWSLPPVPLWAITPAGRQASAKSRAFIAFIERQLAAPPDT
jgi:DNA-binding transcriptional LysR family regulator